jgi:uncharacterized protein YgiM (DUF1202 family)
MRRAIAVILGLLGLVLLVGIPFLVITGQLDKYLPGGTAPAVQVIEPAVTVEPTEAMQTPEPTLAIATPTDTPAPTATPTPAPEITEAPTVSTTEAMTETATPVAPGQAAIEAVVAIQANLRQGPGTEFPVVGTVNPGDRVAIVGRNDAGDWYKLDSGAWIFGELLETTPDVPIAGPEPELTSVTATVNADANLRSGPGTEFDIVDGVKFGSQVTIVGRTEDGQWYLLDNNSWLYSSLIDEAVPVPVVSATGERITPTPAPTPTSEATAEAEATVEATTGAVANAPANLREGPGIDFPVVGTAQQGEALTIVGRNEAGDWYQLDSGAWIFAPLVDNAPADLPVAPATTETPTPEATVETEATATPEAEATVEATPTEAAPEAGATPEAGPVANTAANLREGPGTDFPVVGTAQAGDALTIVGRNEAGDWYQLDSGAWIFAALVDNAPADLPVVPVAQATPTPEATPEAEATVEATPAVEASPTTEATPAGEATPEATPEAEATPAATPEAEATVETTPTVEASPTPEATPAGEATPEATATVEATPAAETTPEATPEATTTPTANANANLRDGPGTNYNVIGGVQAGDPLVLVGQNEAGDWYQLDSGAWIFAALVDNAPTDLPVVPAPPAP